MAIYFRSIDFDLPKPGFSALTCFSMGWELNGKEKATQNIMKQVKLIREMDHHKCEHLIKSAGKLGWDYPAFKLYHTWGCTQASIQENFLCQGEGGAPLVCQEYHSSR